MSRLAVVLFNLGGPDSLESVRPFLFNLFHDPAIIGVPQPIRWMLAQFISRRRERTAQQIYSYIGGKSPLLELTQQQALALKSNLKGTAESVEVFVCMRYWNPMARAVTEAVKTYDPDKIVLLPLYPQYSTTTVSSSLADWKRAAKKSKLSAPTYTICCYPRETGWVSAQADLVLRSVERAESNTRILFSAHGLPLKVVQAGDPYQWQVEQTAIAIIEKMGGHSDWTVCYQSRVGPLEWIGPSTEEELERAANDGVGVTVVPIAFVSEHSETLVELDIEYKELAKELGIVRYCRVPALGIHPTFIDGLGKLVRRASCQDEQGSYGGADGSRICPKGFRKCPKVFD